MSPTLNEMTLVAVAVALVCVMSTMRGLLATITGVPLVGQALQVLGLVYLAQLAWARWRPSTDETSTYTWPSMDMFVRRPTGAPESSS